jgi:hypothetical protein
VLWCGYYYLVCVHLPHWRVCEGCELCGSFDCSEYWCVLCVCVCRSVVCVWLCVCLQFIPGLQWCSLLVIEAGVVLWLIPLWGGRRQQPCSMSIVLSLISCIG